MTVLGIRLLAGSMVAACLAAQTADAPRVEALEQKLASQRKLLTDWAGLTRYGSENAEIRPQKPGEKRVIFFGDQVTER